MLTASMTPPKFSKPKQKLCPSEVQNRRDYRTIFSIRRPKMEHISTKPVGAGMVQSLRPVWDESDKAEAEMKQWISVNNLQDRPTTVKRRYAKKPTKP
jgi:hypothetical protein